MTTKQLEKIHSDILDVYKTQLIPVFEKYFNNQNDSEVKSGGEYADTLVTQADIAVNDILLQKLPKILPGASVISEESEADMVTENTFIIDPIDGTHSFARNLDDWGVSIELVSGGKVVYSLLIFPQSNTEYFYAIGGLGSFDSNGNDIVAKKTFEFKPTFVSAPLSRRIGRALIDYSEGKKLSFRAYGSAIFAGYTMFRGGTDFLVYDNLNTWDILGVAFIAENAGFKVEWITEKPVFDNSMNLKEIKSVLVIYKPDFPKDILGDFMEIVRG